MTKDDYIREIRSLDESYYDMNLRECTFEELEEILHYVKYPYAPRERYEDHSTAFNGEEVIHYSNGRRQRKRGF